MSERYPYIRVWATLMGSFNYYIVQQQAIAEQENAPANVIYRTKVTTADGESSYVWSTTDDILASSTRRRFEAECECLGIQSPWAAQSTAF